jgi:hypothetical protein
VVASTKVLVGFLLVVEDLRSDLWPVMAEQVAICDTSW